MGERKSKILPTPDGSKPALRGAIAVVLRREKYITSKPKKNKRARINNNNNNKMERQREMYTVLLILSREREREGRKRRKSFIREVKFLIEKKKRKNLIETLSTHEWTALKRSQSTSRRLTLRNLLPSHTSKKHKKTWLLNQLKCASSKRPAPANTRYEFMHRLLSFLYSYSSLSLEKESASCRCVWINVPFLSLSRRLFSIIYDATFSLKEDEEEPKPASNEEKMKNQQPLLFFRETARFFVLSSKEKKRKISPQHGKRDRRTCEKKRRRKSFTAARAKKNPKSRQSRPSSRREGESFGTRRLSRSGEVKSSERVT
jgi:hypothetical protein